MDRIKTRPLITALTAALGLCSMGSAAAQFRVNPYLQNPSSSGMYFTWFTTAAQGGSLSVFEGNGTTPVASFSTSPSFESVLSYTHAEKNQSISGLVKGSWLLPDSNYKHTVDVTGLKADTSYRYVVQQGTETFESSFRTAPTRDSWNRVRFMAMSDAETEPAGRTTHREWSPGALAAGSLARPATGTSAWHQRFGSTTLSGVPVLRYAMTEDEGYRRNLEIVHSRRPDFILKPGDLVQGGGYQPGWDEFFRQNAGAVGSGLSSTPVLPALGNWENFGALNGGYGVDADGRFGPKFGRDKYHVYFDAPSNGTAAHRDNYYRVDYGPVTIITLDSSNGEPEDRPQNHPVKATGQTYNGPGTDTQNNYTRTQYESFGGTDLSDYNPGSIQWNWAQTQLADARARGQVVFVQFHHAPFSNGEHGLPMDHALTSGQGGTPMRQYHTMFEQFGVAAVFSGHSEMFERSFVDANGDGVGVTYYDVGVSGDGLRGERRNGSSLNDPLLKYNPFSQWTADQLAGEQWMMVDGVLQLVDGGKHYGHLEVDVEYLGTPDFYARVKLSPVYSFPVLNSSYDLVRTERRVYGDPIELLIGANGAVVPVPEPESWALLLAGLGLVGAVARRHRRV